MLRHRVTVGVHTAREFQHVGLYVRVHTMRAPCSSSELGQLLFQHEIYRGKVDPIGEYT